MPVPHKFKSAFRAVSAAAEGAVGGWAIAERWDEEERWQAIGVAAAMLAPFMLKRKMLELGAVVALAAAGYFMHHLMQKDEYKVFAAPIEAADARGNPSMN